MYKFESWGGRKDSRPSLARLVSERENREISEEVVEQDVQFSNSDFGSKTVSSSGGTVIFTANISSKCNKICQAKK